MITTRRIHQTILSSLELQFENQDLVEDLRAAKNQTEALNEQLEARVEERTAELNRSNAQLRAEITQREQVEEELLRARKLESLGVLAGGIAHDFNNFLTVVQGNIEMAKSSLAAAEPVRRILDETVSACRKAAFLSSQLLTFAKGGAPVRRLVSVAKLIMDVRSIWREPARRPASRFISRKISGSPRSIPGKSAKCSTIFCSTRGRRCRKAELSRFAPKMFFAKIVHGLTVASAFPSATMVVESPRMSYLVSSTHTSRPKRVVAASVWRRLTTRSLPSTAVSLLRRVEARVWLRVYNRSAGLAREARAGGSSPRRDAFRRGPPPGDG